MDAGGGKIKQASTHFARPRIFPSATKEPLCEAVIARFTIKGLQLLLQQTGFGRNFPLIFRIPAHLHPCLGGQEKILLFFLTKLDCNLKVCLPFSLLGMTFPFFLFPLFFF